MNQPLKLSLVTLLVALLLIVAGCSNETTSNTNSSSNTSTSSQAAQETTTSGDKTATNNKTKASETITVKLYYPDEQGLNLKTESRTIKVENNDKYTTTIKALLVGTNEKGLTNIIPKQAKLNSVTVKKNVAYVDFSQSLVKSFVGGSTGEEMLVGSIVNTLTEFPEINAVQILVDGKKIDSLSGHLDLSEPISRMKNLLK